LTLIRSKGTLLRFDRDTRGVIITPTTTLELPLGQMFVEVKSPGWEAQIAREEGQGSSRLLQPKYINGEGRWLDSVERVREAVSRAYPQFPPRAAPGRPGPALGSPGTRGSRTIPPGARAPFQKMAQRFRREAQKGSHAPVRAARLLGSVVVVVSRAGPPRSWPIRRR
jgi:hypothetical protein